MEEKNIKKFRNITLFLWVFFPVFVIATPMLEKILGLYDWRGVFILIYMILCAGFGYKLQKTICPDCGKYMFRKGKGKYALKKFLFKQCGQCGYELGRM